jgi:cytochrome c5
MIPIKVSRRTSLPLRLALATTVTAVAMSVAPAAAETTAEAAVTYTKDIAPILERSCQHCHRPESVAPMSLLTYEDTRPWARAIKYRTDRVGKPDVMPP